MRGSGLALVSLHGRPRPATRICLLGESLAAGDTDIGEVGDGRVDAIRVDHRGHTPLLLLDGEEVVGAKQNRIFNASFVVAPGSVVDVPVSCVEAGRWCTTSPGFESSGHTLVASARAAKLKRVSTTLVSGGGYDARQREVWRDVHQYLERTGTTSVTAAHSDATRRRGRAVEIDLGGIELAEDQIGIAAVSGGKVVSMDLVGDAALFRRAWPTIARGVLADVLPCQMAGDPADPVRRCLDGLQRHVPSAFAAPGLGATLTVSSAGYAATAVVHDDAIVHLVATSA